MKESDVQKFEDDLDEIRSSHDPEQNVTPNTVLWKFLRINVHPELNAHDTLAIRHMVMNHEFDDFQEYLTEEYDLECDIKYLWYGCCAIVDGAWKEAN